MGLFGHRKVNIEEIYDRYADMLYRLALSHLQNPDDAQDAVQDVFAKFLSDTPSFKTGDHEKAWFIRVTINQCRDSLRKSKVRSFVPLEDISGEAASTGESGTWEIMKTLNGIPDTLRDVIVLHYLEGYSVEKTAEILNLSESAVKMRLKRGREALKNKFQEE